MGSARIGVCNFSVVLRISIRFRKRVIPMMIECTHQSALPSSDSLRRFVMLQPES